ncbi:YcnI family copper-binding membrane protein [Naasia aerilata]|uniref:YncI copper-binding domain-containing protein n=1 Tax=Naasia aerilata TaxID=1162966 RepID=A0ABM8G7V6_9MICO|nr:YcnI family protein [Naasia aerilata]BDZ44252.1 hypothetical protein GCM10025866_01610 [Naasia aerilata]
MHTITSSSRRVRRRALAAGILGTALALAAPLAASAHVRVTPDQAEPGGYSQLTFRVPNESDTAGTVRVEVTLPADTPFASVSYQPVAGWTTTADPTPLPKPVTVNGNDLTEAVTSVVWQADPGVQIAPGQFQLFTLSVGPVPEVGSITLPATQTYSDGTVAEWNGDAEAEEPAPVVYVTDPPPARTRTTPRRRATSPR